MWSAHHKFRLYTLFRSYIHKVRYTAPADSYKPIYIDPNAIEFKENYFLTQNGLNQVKSGWENSSNITPLEEYHTYKGLKQRYELGYDWEDTALYQDRKEKFNRRGSYAGYSSIDQWVEIRCSFIDELFKDIRDNGYRPNFSSSHEVAHTGSSRNNQTSYKHELEPLIAIGSDGEIYWSVGFHRLTIASILNIESIPVNILVVSQTRLES